MIFIDPPITGYWVLKKKYSFPNNDLLKIEIVNDVRSVKLLGNHIVF